MKYHSLFLLLLGITSYSQLLLTMDNQITLIAGTQNFSFFDRLGDDILYHLLSYTDITTIASYYQTNKKAFKSIDRINTFDVQKITVPKDFFNCHGSKFDRILIRKSPHLTQMCEDQLLQLYKAKNWSTGDRLLMCLYSKKRCKKELSYIRSIHQDPILSIEKFRTSLVDNDYFLLCCSQIKKIISDKSWDHLLTNKSMFGQLGLILCPLTNDEYNHSAIKYALTTLNIVMLKRLLRNKECVDWIEKNSELALSHVLSNEKCSMQQKCAFIDLVLKVTALPTLNSGSFIPYFSRRGHSYEVTCTLISRYKPSCKGLHSEQVIKDLIWLDIDEQDQTNDAIDLQRTLITGDLDSIQDILKDDANRKWLNDNTQKALKLACHNYKEKHEIIELILRETNISLADNGDLAQSLLLEHTLRYYDIIKLIKKYKPSYRTTNARTILHEVAGGPSYETLLTILENIPVDEKEQALNAQDPIRSKYTPLIQSYKYTTLYYHDGAINILEELLKQTECKDIPDEDNNRLLHHFATQNKSHNDKDYENYIQQVINKQWDVNSKNNEGQTPLMLALEKENIPFAKALLACDAIDIYVCNKNHKCTIDYAQSDEMKELITSHKDYKSSWYYLYKIKQMCNGRLLAISSLIIALLSTGLYFHNS